MQTKTVVPVSTFKSPFAEGVPCRGIRALLRFCGVRRRCPPVVSTTELIRGLVFHVVAEAGTLAQPVKALTGKKITDGALSRRRALLPMGLFEHIMAVAVMVELGLHNPLAAASGAGGESGMVLARHVLSAQPEDSLLIKDRYYGLRFASSLKWMPRRILDEFVNAPVRLGV